MAWAGKEEKRKRNADDLASARQSFETVEAISERLEGDPHNKVLRERRRLAITLLQRSLASSGADWAALDPEGKRDGAEMESVVKNILWEYHVGDARKIYEQLKHGTVLKKTGQPFELFSPEQSLRLIDRNLREAGADYSALDPEGKIGHHEMKHKILPAAVRNAHIRQARQDFAELREGIHLGGAIAIGMAGGRVTSPQSLVDSIRDHLYKAGADLSALDPEGKKNVREMARELVDACNNHKYNADTLKEDMEVLRDFPGRDTSRRHGRGR